jgi:Trypsin-like peptidase domain
MVLTAAHVVADAVEVRVRFDADRPEEWVAEATVAWADATIDVAVLTIDAGAGGAGALGPVGFGRVGERDAVLACSVMGFPRFKLRNDPARRGSGGDAGRLTQYRDSAHAVGTIAVLSNRREGTLEVSVPSPERDLDPQASPWEGMSGAAVWSGGRIVGLVGEHHRRDGLGRLAAWRVDRWYERLPADRLAELGALLGLPAQAHGLAEVVPPAAGELLVAGYAAQVRDIAPEVLVDREEELAELVRFCAGQERYRWWQARPWAGKSALAAWLVLHPPAGVTVVSFFVTGRLAGQADSDAFTEAMVEQLAAVAGEPLSATAASATLAGRDRERRRLLEAAAARVSEQGGRLLVVVDGLDEDEGATPGSGKPSIASLLPKRPPEGVRVLVTSRPHPGVPADVPGDHPLHRCYHHPRLLTPSPHAQHLEQEANHELLELLAGDRLGIDVIALLSAAGGGLTLAELAELTGQPHHKLQGKLGSVLGRSLRTRLARDEPPDRAGRVYLFAHETLRALAEAQLGRDLGPYRQRIHQWADRYRTRGWPEATPRYLLRPYGRLLAASGDLERLVAIATDPARQDRMLAATHGDAAALAEITTAQQRILAQPPPDLAALGRLAVFRDRLATRNRAIPRELPILWARLGQGHHAEALARSITDPEDRAWALIKLTELLVGADRDRALRLAADAEQAARTITDPKDQATALAEVAEALAGIGAYDRAEALARSITDPKDQAWALVKLAEALVEANRDRALRLAADAEQTARAITDPEDQARALGNLAWALAGVDRDRAGRLKADAEQAADAITDPPWQGETLAWVGTALDGGDYDHAEAFARSIDDPKDQATALAWVAEALARDGAYDRAEALARSIDDPKDQATVLAQVAEALARNGAYDRAEAFARSIDDPKGQATALVKLAEALVEVDRDRALVLAADAEQAARTITHPSWQASLRSPCGEARSGVKIGLVAR